jgi:hypothetical protein
MASPPKASTSQSSRFWNSRSAFFFLSGATGDRVRFSEPREGPSEDQAEGQRHAEIQVGSRPWPEPPRNHANLQSWVPG